MALDSDNQPINVFSEIGLTGLVRYSGFVFEEFLRELQGLQGMRIYREMRDNDPTIGAMLFAFNQLCRRVTWRVNPNPASPTPQDDADFLQSCMDDMSETWADNIGEILSMVPFGFSWHEVVYKRRLGAYPGDDQDGTPLATSRFNDGYIGWRKWPIRAQETMWMWDFDEKGAIKAMIQRAPPDFEMNHIPIEKSLLFRHRAHKNNPEGVSALRNAYRPWYFKKQIEKIEAIGIERDLAGLPVLKVPGELLAPTATPAQKTALNYWKQLVTNIRNDEQAGIILPSDVDPDTKAPLFELSLLSTGSKRSIDPNVAITRYDQKIAQTLLSDLILIGSGTGSYALMEAKAELFSHAIEGWLDSIVEVVNRHAIPKLFKLNGFQTEHLPSLAHGRVKEQDLRDLSDFMSALTGGQPVITPTAADESFFREVAGLPTGPTDAADMSVGKSAFTEAVTELRDAVRKIAQEG